MNVSRFPINRVGEGSLIASRKSMHISLTSASCRAPLRFYIKGVSSNFERINGLSKEERDHIIRVEELLTYEFDIHDKKVIMAYEKREMKIILARFSGFVTFKKPEKKEKVITRTKKAKESFIEPVAQVKTTRILHITK